MDIAKRVFKFVGASLIYSYIFFIDIYFCLNITNDAIRNVLLPITLIILLYFSIIGVGIKGYVFEKYSGSKRAITQVTILLFTYILNEIFHYLNILKI